MTIIPSIISVKIHAPKNIYSIIPHPPMLCVLYFRNRELFLIPGHLTQLCILSHQRGSFLRLRRTLTLPDSVCFLVLILYSRYLNQHTPALAPPTPVLVSTRLCNPT